MKIIKYPSKSQWPDIVKRPHLDLSQLNATVKNVLDDVKAHGDEAVRHYEQQFDHVSLDSLAVSEEEIEEAFQTISTELKASLELAHHNIAAFHEAQRFEGKKIETAPGVDCWQKSVPIEKV